MSERNYQYRHIARVVVEAATPLCVGTGQKEIYTDATVAKDVNGLPYIPGSSIAGVVRHALEERGSELKEFFGFQSRNDGQGSEIIFSEAKMIGADGIAVDGLQIIDFDDNFYRDFEWLPVRQHVRISHRGAAENHGKFDEEVVLKGTRFSFEIEAVSQNSENKDFDDVLAALHRAELRLGGGSRKGFGKIKVIECKKKVLDLACKDHLQWYLDHSSSLEQDFDGENVNGETQSNATVYELTLRPDDFFLFGAGFGDNEADIVPVKEKIVTWSDGKPKVEERMLIPASSIKGALAHRVAFHHNKKHGIWAEENNHSVENKAVVELFGSPDAQKPQRGIVLFEDILEAVPGEKVFNHVKIDRFTGGAVDGALFQEKATYGAGTSFTTHITLLGDASNDAVEALEAALADLCNGMLPLGGGTTKGYGSFTGNFQKTTN